LLIPVPQKVDCPALIETAKTLLAIRAKVIASIKNFSTECKHYHFFHQFF
jgi:hypothetical protein